jgi:hypothetical protein
MASSSDILIPAVEDPYRADELLLFMGWSELRLSKARPKHIAEPIRRHFRRPTSSVPVLRPRHITPRNELYERIFGRHAVSLHSSHGPSSLGVYPQTERLSGGLRSVEQNGEPSFRLTLLIARDFLVRGCRCPDLRSVSSDESCPAPQHLELLGELYAIAQPPHLPAPGHVVDRVTASPWINRGR